MMPAGSSLRSSGPIRSTLRLAGGSLYVAAPDPPGFQPLVEPGQEEHVPQSGLDRRSPGEQRVREHVSKAPQPHLVERALLLEQIQHAPHLVAVARRQVDPRQRWLHLLFEPALFSHRVGVGHRTGRTPGDVADLRNTRRLRATARTSCWPAFTPSKARRAVRLAGCPGRSAPMTGDRLRPESVIALRRNQ